jgi:flavin-dependent dehydrogenase
LIVIRNSIPRAPYDTVIVGARCAGAATAMLLARAGHRVLVVDRGRYGTDTLSTHALMRGAVVQLHRWDVLPAVTASGTPPVRQATFVYGDESVTVPIKPRDGVDALYAPRRHVLDRLLVDAASAAGADVVYGVRIKGLQRSETGRVTGVVLEDEAGHVRHISSRIVVGADGLGSTVARMTGATVYRVGQHAAATMYGHWPGLEVGGYEWYFAPGLSAGAIPTNDGQVCVFVAVPGPAFTSLFARPKVEAETVFRGLLSQVAPRLADQFGPVGESRLRGFPGQVGFFRQSYGPGWALVGDAGYFKDPLTSHGITDALRDAQLLADAIDVGSDAALADYQAQRDAASLDLFETTDAVASFNWNLTSVRVLHEALARAMSKEVKELGRKPENVPR